MTDSHPPQDSVGRLPLRESRGGGRHGGQEAKADEATRGPTRRVPAEEVQERRRHPRSEGEVRQQRVERVSRPRARRPSTTGGERRRRSAIRPSAATGASTRSLSSKRRTQATSHCGALPGADCWWAAVGDA